MQRLTAILFSTTVGLALLSCGNDDDQADTDTSSDSDTDTDSDTDSDSDTDTDTDGVFADVQAVSADGKPGDYNFAVTVLSPDIDCDQYADWWEVLTEKGDLVFRRILAHSHPDEQPFTRDGGPVIVEPDDTLIVRAHMYPTGYGGEAMRGTVEDGFKPAPDITADFAPEVEDQDPQPDECLY